MNKRLVINLFLLVVIVVGSGISFSPVRADTSHCGTLAASEAWSNAGNVHTVTCDVTIPPGVTLTIAPGAIVKFYIGTRLIVNGSLTAVGTSGNRIYFTSIKDDAVGGDTNADGFATSPAVYDWARVEFGTGSSATLDYLTIRYTGRYPGGAALFATGYVIPVVGNNVSLTNNAINGIEIPGGNLPVTPYTFPYYPAAAYYIDSSLTIPAGVTVTVAPGAVLKFAIGAELIVNGTLTAVGTSTDRIYFTSIKDDAIGGDTNADGTASSPAVYDWARVEFGTGSSATLDYLTIRYTGRYPGGGALYLNGGVVGISHALLTQNDIGLEANGAGVAIHNSDITGNTTYGVRNDLSGVWLDATNNWWGDASGPKDIGTADGNNNPNGLGDQVTDWVAYSPWIKPPMNYLYLPLIRR